MEATRSAPRKALCAFMPPALSDLVSLAYEDGFYYSRTSDRHQGRGREFSP
jgi:hypothetical protein